MFTGIYTQPNTHFIKGPKDAPIPIQNLNRCGMIVYGFTAFSFLVTVISYMIFPAFQTEIVTSVTRPIEGQNCTIMSAFTGELNKVELNPQVAALNTADFTMLKCCLTDPTLKTESFSSTNNVCPTPSQYTGGTEITNTYGMKPKCVPGDVSSEGKPIFDKLTGIFQSFKCANFLINGEIGLYTKITNSKFLPETLRPNGRVLYFSTKDQCLSDLKLNIDINRVDVTKDFYGGTDAVNGVCSYNMKAATLTYTFSNEGLNNFLDAGDGLDIIASTKTCGSGTGCDYLTNIVAQSSPSQTYGYWGIAKLGFMPGEVCPGYDPVKMLEFYNLLYPTWLEDVCSTFDYMPPYQCTVSKSPSFVSALGSSLAIMNTLLASLCVLTVYMFQNGIDLTGKLFGNSSTSTDVTPATKELEMSEETTLKAV